MISFVIIGRNEGWKLTKCIKSVQSVVSKNSISDFEIVYVDSKSTDDSIDRAKRFKKIKIIKIIGECNAAIGRNIGAKEAKGDVFFFIDGDMEIQAEFLSLVYDEINGLKYDFVSGDFLNVNYNNYGEIISKERYFNNHKMLIQKGVGGLFLIKRELWHLVNGMRVIFKKSQDIDFALRLAKKKIFLKRLPLIAAHHHTTHYMNNKRKWKDLFSGVHLYARSLLYRKNILNIFVYKRILKNDYSMIILFLFLLVSLYTMNGLFIVVYFIVLLVRAKFSIENLLYYCFRDITVLIGLFVFFPSSKFYISYNCVEKKC